MRNGMFTRQSRTFVVTAAAVAVFTTGACGPKPAPSTPAPPPAAPAATTPPAQTPPPAIQTQKLPP